MSLPSAASELDLEPVVSTTTVAEPNCITVSAVAPHFPAPVVFGPQVFCGGAGCGNVLEKGRKCPLCGFQN